MTPEGLAGYEAAVGGVAVRVQERAFLGVTGRAPGQMLQGIVTSSLPAPERGADGRRGRALYSTVLTPRGRMLTDLRLFRTDGGPASGEEESFLLDLPPAGAGPLEEYFARVLPPRFARVSDLSDQLGVATVVGPAGRSALARLSDGAIPEDDARGPLKEGEYRLLETGLGRVRLVRAEEVAAVAYDLVGPRTVVEAFREELEGEGAARLDDEAWQTLRIEAGRPAFGVDLDEETIPLEAGLGERAFDHAKGCYTGQEVIVRILHRGHVNRHLRGLRLPDDAQAVAGTELYAPEVRDERPVGRLTSVARSPRKGMVALGWVRREIEPGGTVTVGRISGWRAEVRELTSF